MLYFLESKYRFFCSLSEYEQFETLKSNLSYKLIICYYDTIQNL